MDTGVFAVRLATRAGILLAHMLDAFEVAGKIFHLPALIGTNLLALDTAARAQALFSVQFVNVRGNWKVFEVSQIAPPQARCAHSAPYPKHEDSAGQS